MEFAPEFLSRPWTVETLDLMGQKLTELHKLTPDVLVKHECLYIVTRLLGERRRSGLAEPLVRLLAEHKREDRHIAKYVLAKIDDRSCSSAGQLLGPGLASLPDYFRRYVDPAELRLQFYDGP